MGQALLNFAISFTDTHCCKCQARFAITTDAFEKLSKTHETHFCPLCGCAQHFTGKSDEERLREQLAEAERNRDWHKQRAADERAAREKVARRLVAQRGATKRLSNRVKNGVCPCCTRSFANLREHMKHQHPDYKAEVA
jgi:hypothetical protein